MASTELRVAAQQTQPEALRLADALEISSNHGIRREAAAELRRLYAELERCKQVCAATPEAWREEAALGCDHCNSPLYAAVKCRVCGRVTEPVQEPYAWMAVGGTIWRHKTSENDVPLYTAPRVPLAEWQINDLMADIDPEDRDSWSFRQGVYAAEKYHGVRK